MCKWTYVECLLILLIYVILNCTLSSCDVLGFTHLQMTPQMWSSLKLNVTHCYFDNLPNVSVSPLPFSAIDLKIWFKGMRTRYGKLTCKKFGDGAKEHTDRDTWILRSFSFLDDHISRVPSRQSCNVSTFSQSDSPGYPDVFTALCILDL